MPDDIAPQIATQRSSVDKKLAWEAQLDDQEEAWRLRPSLGFFCILSLTGVLLACGWHFLGGAQEVGRIWSSVSPTTSSAKAADNLVSHFAAELTTLKNEIIRLRDNNQQMAAAVAGLQARWQELENHSASPSARSHLFSDPTILQMRLVPIRHPVPTNPSPSATASAPRSEARNRPTSPTNSPLSLAPQN